jgi:hypothetical protein
MGVRDWIASWVAPPSGPSAAAEFARIVDARAKRLKVSREDVLRSYAEGLGSPESEEHPSDTNPIISADGASRDYPDSPCLDAGELYQAAVVGELPPGPTKHLAECSVCADAAMRAKAKPDLIRAMAVKLSTPPTNDAAINEESEAGSLARQRGELTQTLQESLRAGVLLGSTHQSTGDAALETNGSAQTRGVAFGELLGRLSPGFVTACFALLVISGAAGFLAGHVSQQASRQELSWKTNKGEVSLDLNDPNGILVLPKTEGGHHYLVKGKVGTLYIDSIEQGAEVEIVDLDAAEVVCGRVDNATLTAETKGKILLRKVIGKSAITLNADGDVTIEGTIVGNPKITIQRCHNFIFIGDGGTPELKYNSPTGTSYYGLSRLPSS